MTRIESEYRGVIQWPRQGDARRVIVLGNSLLMIDVDYPDFERRLGPGWTTRRFVVEQTTYLDWLYALRRIRDAGARADAFVLMLSPRQFIITQSLGSYSAFRMYQAKDVLAASRDLDLHPTQTADMLVSHYSAFFGLRRELRKVLLGRLMPSLPALTGLISQNTPPLLTEEEVYEGARPRLERLKQEAAAVGAGFVFIVAPTQGNEDQSPAMVRAGRDAGVPVVVAPITRQLGPADYQPDGFHLLPRGAARYTESLTPVLAEALHGSLAAARQPVRLKRD